MKKEVKLEAADINYARLMQDKPNPNCYKSASGRWKMLRVKVVK